MNENWNDDWRYELEKDNPKIYNRLCDCQSTKNDLIIIAKIMYKYNLNYTKEEVLDRTISWITDWNSQVELIPDKDEYDKILERM